MIKQLYKHALKPVFFKMDPEDVHNRMTRLGVLLGKISFGRKLTRGLFHFDHPALHNTVAGIDFKNPVGLAAGFDKNAQLYNILPEIGFGHAEFGSITGQPCLGNPRPRLFRLPQEKSILVNYGLYNKGAEAISHRLANIRFNMPVGFSVAKTNDPSLGLEEGIKDYRKAYLHMHPLGNYTTINVSCPNTADGITYQDPHKLAPLLDAIAKEKHSKPIFLKIKSDFTNAELAEVAGIADKHQWVTGFIISNLRTNRKGLNTSKEQIDALSTRGALSGIPVQEQSNKAISFVSKHTNKIIIGCGGIFTGKDAYEKIKSGASLLQLVTALIYEGPSAISEINKELVNLIQQDGYSNIAEVIKETHK